MKVILLCFLLLPNISFAVDCNILTEDQISNLKMAYTIGQKITFNNDHFGETIASILWQETKAGCEKYRSNGFIVGDKNRKGKPKSLGLMQVQIRAARDVEKWYPKIFEKEFGKNYSPTNEELLIRLLIQPEFNISVGAAYYKKMLSIKKNWRKSILAYNRGA